MYCSIAYLSSISSLTGLLFLSCLADAKILLQSYAALGDSYAAGDGVGSSKLLPNLDATCGRFSRAYPVLIANSSKLNIQPFDFHHVACGGATTKSIILDQLSHLREAELVTVQVGGNEVDFFPLLNECIQQWRPFSTCDREINRARALIQSTSFIEAFYTMVTKAKQRAGDEALLLVLGYARFFNADTNQCNHASFSKTNPANVLSNELRHAFNELVVMLNNVIRSSAEVKGAVYVDIDPIFEGHRFCEDGVEEPRPDWEGTWFFREKSVKRLVRGLSHTDGATPGESQQQISVWPNPFKEFADLTRTFHPTENGHVAIAEEIIDTVVKLKSSSI